jgi:UPF0176 protein
MAPLAPAPIPASTPAQIHVLLYYCFAEVADPLRLQQEQLTLCLSLDLRGRIIVAPEGLNGTVSGSEQACNAYKAAVLADPRFASTDFKTDLAHAHTFEKINVRLKNEIVNAGIPEIKPYERTGQHLTPAEWHAMMHDPDVVLLDVRSEYEHSLGRFKNAITLPMSNFRHFPEHVPSLAHLKDKKILTYCTGGIKCEKASAFLLDQGFENVYQLLGGIIRYGIEEQGEDFEGRCYVFDGRISVEVNTVNPSVVSTCHSCNSAQERMINCANPECNIHIPMCTHCADALAGACSDECKAHPLLRTYDGTGLYMRELNGYKPGLGYVFDGRQITATLAEKPKRENYKLWP